MGGLSRKAYIISNYSKEHLLPTLLLDAGNLLFKRQQKKNTSDKEMRTAHAIINSYVAMQYEAVAVGPLDLALGVDFLLDQSTSQLPWVSANIYNQDGNRVFSPSLTIEKSGISIAIIGLANNVKQSFKNLVITGWEAELSNLMPSLSSSHDMVVLLTTLPYKEILLITDRFPEIHIIIGADKRKGNINGILKNRTLFAQTASQGKYLGQLSVNWRHRPWQEDFLKKRSLLERQLTSVNRQQVKLEKNGSKGINTFEKKKASLTEKQAQLSREILGIERNIEAQATTEQPSTWANVLLPISPSIPEDSEIKAIVKAAKNKPGENRTK